MIRSSELLPLEALEQKVIEAGAKVRRTNKGDAFFEFPAVLRTRSERTTISWEEGKETNWRKSGSLILEPKKFGFETELSGGKEFIGPDDRNQYMEVCAWCEKFKQARKAG